MSGLSSSQSSPNDYSSEDREDTQFSQILNNQHTQFNTNSFLYPIDETEDFYDPFSELSLFLSTKIKKEIQGSGSIKQWSGKIQTDLLAKILPEFKQKFPKYRLGASALKKVWEKSPGTPGIWLGYRLQATGLVLKTCSL